MVTLPKNLPPFPALAHLSLLLPAQVQVSAPGSKMRPAHPQPPRALVNWLLEDGCEKISSHEEGIRFSLSQGHLHLQEVWKWHHS